MNQQAFETIWDALEPDPIMRNNLQLRSQLLSALIDVLDTMTPDQALQQLNINAEQLQSLLAGRIDLFTIDELITLLEKIGRHITLSIAA